MPDSRDLILAREARLATREPFHVLLPAETVAVDGAVMDGNFAWVTEVGRPESRRKVLSSITLREAGIPVLIEIDPKRPSEGYIYDLDTSTVLPKDTVVLTRFRTGPHAENHQWPSESTPGPDPYKLFQPADWRFRTYYDGTSLTVSTYPLIYTNEGVVQEFPGATTDLTNHVPGTASKVLWVLLYLVVATGLLEVLEGTEVTDNGVIPVPRPKIPSGGIGSAYIKLATSQTSVTAADYKDARGFLSAGSGRTSPYSATEAGQILIAHEGTAFTEAKPLVDQYGAILTDQAGSIVTA